MNIKRYWLYYLSRGFVSTLFGLLIFGLSWKGALAAVVLFGLFLLYLHSGWYQVDPERPLTPLRRDSHGQDVQRKALIAAVAVGMILYGGLKLLPSGIPETFPSGSLAISAGALAYFGTQFYLFLRA